MPKKRTHEDNRKLLCLVCFNKAQEIRNISDNIYKLIVKYLIEDGYTREDDRLPSGICGTCRSWLLKKENASTSDQINISSIPFFDHSSILAKERNMRTRNSEIDCSCTICTIASVKGRNVKSELSIVKRKIGRPSENDTDETSKPVKICDKCLTIIGRGKPHLCTLQSKLSNITNNFLQNDREHDQLASKIIDSKIPAPSSTNIPIKLTREAGYPLSLVVSPESTKTTNIFTVDSIAHIQEDLNLSVRSRNKVTAAIRQTLGSSFVEPCIRNKIYIKEHCLDDFFIFKEIPFVNMTDKGKSVQHIRKKAIVCKNIEVLVCNVIQERYGGENEKENVWIKLGLDGGGGFLKFILTIYSKNKQQVESSASKSKFSDSGVKRCFIVAIVPNIQENYTNVKNLWVEISLHLFEREFHISTDLKLCNILLGLMSHSCMYPCCWCDSDKHNLHLKGKTRTIGSLNSSFWEYHDSGSSKKEAKHFGNVVHPILIKGDNDSPVLCHVPPPELHLLTGSVFFLFSQMKNIWPDANKWLFACNIELQHYHGGTFKGNDCRKLLKSVDKLRSMCPLNCLQFVDVFESLNKVVSSCFGKDLNFNYAQYLQSFRELYLQLQIAPSPKIHAIMYHVEEFCTMKNEALGIFSEQTPESAHYDFQRHWEKYNVSETNEYFGDKLFQAVCAYNSRHL